MRGHQGPLEGKVALITGASRGIGRATALKLAHAGASIGVNYHLSSEAAEETAQAARRQGNHVVLLKADVADSEQVRRMFQEMEASTGMPDILVNNAGLTRDTLLLRMSEADWDSVLDVNLKGTFLCSRAAARSMVRKRWGRIINMSSVVAMSGNPGQVNYSASKAGVIGLTRTLARELAARSVTVNALAPGFIETDMAAALSEEMRKQVMERVPMGRFGTPEDVAAVVAFLASEEAAYVTGQTIGVDGGIAL